MKRVLLIILLLIFTQNISISAPKKMLPSSSVQNKEQLPNIFIYTIPDTQFAEQEDEQDAPDDDYVDTSVIPQKETIIETEEDDIEENEQIVLGATVLKGYAQFVEDTDVIRLKNDNDSFVLNIKTPQKIMASKGLNLKSNVLNKPIIKGLNDEYIIAPNSYAASSKIGNFTIGAQYNNEVDKYAMLEKETGLFTKYEKGRFILNSSIAKSLDTTSSKDSNSFTISPEFRLNNYMSLKATIDANTTYSKYTSQFAVSFYPFGKNDRDRFNFEIGAKETYYKNTETTTSQLLFSTKFKL